MKNFKNIYLSLTLFAVFMFSFSDMLVPLYDIFCEITGLNGKTNQEKVQNLKIWVEDDEVEIACDAELELKNYILLLRFENWFRCNKNKPRLICCF